MQVKEYGGNTRKETIPSERSFSFGLFCSEKLDWQLINASLFIEPISEIDFFLFLDK